MSKSTPATIALTRAGVAFDLYTYDYDPGSERVGLQAAEALGEDPRRVLKTLI
ncbi:MAG: Cys-tRNA(Pro) deacylase, partial [Caulobacter sp.]